MSSSSNAVARGFEIAPRDEVDGTRRPLAGNPVLTRARCCGGLSFDRVASPLDAELPGPPVAVDPAVAAAE